LPAQRTGSSSSSRSAATSTSAGSIRHADLCAPEHAGAPPRTGTRRDCHALASTNLAALPPSPPHAPAAADVARPVYFYSYWRPDLAVFSSRRSTASSPSSLRSTPHALSSGRTVTWYTTRFLGGIEARTALEGSHHSTSATGWPTSTATSSACSSSELMAACSVYLGDVSVGMIGSAKDVVMVGRTIAAPLGDNSCSRSRPRSRVRSVSTSTQTPFNGDLLYFHAHSP
jgi:hypothetical protein